MKIALLFPGYGSQFVGMGKELYDEYRIVQEYFEEASNCLNVNFVKLCFASSDSELSKLANAYTALFLMGSATYALLKENGIDPDVVAGYNNGESAALFAASCFSFPDGLYLLNKFCSFYQEAIDTMDVDIVRIAGLNTAQIHDVCDSIKGDGGKIFVAVYTGSMDHILVGGRDQISRVRELVDHSASVEYEEVEIGLHCELMNTVVEQFTMYLEKVDFKDLRIPLISGIDGEIVSKGIEIKDRFIRHINSPVKFNIIMDKLVDYDCIIVANPGGEVFDMIKQQYPEKFVIKITKKEDINTIKQMLKEEH